jgi:hypothetical protein
MTDLDRLLEAFDAMGAAYLQRAAGPTQDEPELPPDTAIRVRQALNDFVFDAAGRYLGCFYVGVDEGDHFEARIEAS